MMKIGTSMDSEAMRLQEAHLRSDSVRLSDDREKPVKKNRPAISNIFIFFCHYRPHTCP